jgi:hypothetical protein
MSASALAPPSTQVLETGTLHFLYHAPAGVEHPKRLEDILRLHLLLSPDGHPLWRLLIVGAKKLPELDGHGERGWAFVDRVAASLPDLGPEVRVLTSAEPSRAELTANAEVRRAGQGSYVLARHHDHVHFAYALDIPEAPEEVRRILQIPPEGSFLVSVKNPEAASPPGMGLAPREKAKFAAGLQKEFRGRRFVPLDPPEFLNYPGAELLFIGAKEDVKAELGIDLHPDRERDGALELRTHLQGVRKARTPRKASPSEG